MCPDYQILSVYFDGELPSPWKEKMEEHTAGCPSCKERLERLRQCSTALKATLPPVDVVDEAHEAVWQNMHIGAHRRRLHGRRIWQNSVSVPIPACAAAAMILFASFAFVLTREQSSVDNLSPFAVTHQGVVAEITDMPMPGMIPVSNMNDVLQYLGNQSSSDIVVIELPEIKEFSRFGEPVIINSADYSRRSEARRLGNNQRRDF